jgi:hypothetical protein
VKLELEPLLLPPPSLYPVNFRPFSIDSAGIIHSETAGVIPFSFCGVSFAVAKESLNDLSAV